MFSIKTGKIIVKAITYKLFSYFCQDLDNYCDTSVHLSLSSAHNTAIVKLFEYICKPHPYFRSL